MKILLDECIPRPLKSEFPGYDVYTVQEMNWAGLKNGELLKQAVKNSFDVFITIDQKLHYQQNLQSFKIGVILLITKSNKFAELQALVPNTLGMLENIVPGKVVTIERI